MKILSDISERLSLALQDEGSIVSILQGLAILVVARSIYKTVKYQCYDKPKLEKLRKENAKAKENISELNSTIDEKTQLISTLVLMRKEQEVIIQERYLKALELQRQIQQYGIEPVCKVKPPFFHQPTSIFAESSTFFNVQPVSKNQPIEKRIRCLTNANAEAEEKILESRENNAITEEYIKQQVQFFEENRKQNINQFKNLNSLP